MGAHDEVDDAEAEPAAAAFAGEPLIHLIEGAEDPRPVTPRDADAVILHLEHHACGPTIHQSGTASHQFREFIYRFPGDRIDPFRSNLGQRGQHECALAEPWVRDDQAGLVDHLVAIENQVQVECAGRAGKGPLPSELPLEIEQPLEQRPGRQGRSARDGAVQELRLRANPDRGGAVPAGDADRIQDLAEPGGRVPKQPLAVAEVAAERNRDARGFDQ